MNKLLCPLVFIFLSSVGFAQDAPNTEYVRMNGEWVRAIVENCDTLIVMTLDEITYSEPRTFASNAERAKYMKYKRYALIVHPYAQEAIKLFKETEYVTQHMKARRRRKHMKKLQKRLKSEFEDPLKQLTKMQGRILVKMIEKEMDNNMYDMIKGLRNGWTARYWQTMGKFFGYDLNEGYRRGTDKFMDIILDDLDVSYELPTDEE